MDKKKPNIYRSLFHVLFVILHLDLLHVQVPGRV